VTGNGYTVSVSSHWKNVSTVKYVHCRLKCEKRAQQVEEIKINESISLIQATWPIQEHERQMNGQKTADRKNSTILKTCGEGRKRQTHKTQ